LSVLEDDSNFWEAAKKVDNKSEEDSQQGTTDEKPQELDMTPRPTQEEVDRFKKEDKCFICHKRGHIDVDCLDRKNKKNNRMRKPRPGK
jgi:hypothetical protein